VRNYVSHLVEIGKQVVPSKHDAGVRHSKQQACLSAILRDTATSSCCIVQFSYRFIVSDCPSMQFFNNYHRICSSLHAIFAVYRPTTVQATKVSSCIYYSGSPVAARFGKKARYLIKSTRITTAEIDGVWSHPGSFDQIGVVMRSLQQSDTY